MKKNQSGFSVVTGLVVLLVVGVIGLIGWYVMDQKVSNKTTTSNQAATDGSKEYSDESFTLSYPAGWTVERNDNELLAGSKELNVTSPVTKFPLAGVADQDLQLQLNVYLHPKDEVVSGCNDCTALNEVVKLNNPHIPHATLLFIETTMPAHDYDDKADSMMVVASESVKVGDKKHDAIRVAGKVLTITTQFFDSGSIYGGQNFTSIDELKATQTYEDLIKILNSLQVK